ncbi:response regulator [candidate division KSB1 bacterium]|nr:response regulator [candidate division KSB1 bacterium]
MNMPEHRVLIVDDEEDLTWSITKSLKRENRISEVNSFNSGSEALEILQNERVDLLVTDLRMPGINGFALIKYIQEKKLNTKIIIMTAYRSEEILNKVLMDDKCSFIEKPFEMSSLKQKIYKILEPVPLKVKNDASRKILHLLDTTTTIDDLRVTLVSGSKKGRLYISKGQIYQAELGYMNGKNALDEMLNWDHCRLEVESPQNP